MDNIYKRYLLRIINKYNEGDSTKEEKDFLESLDQTFDLKDDLVTDENEAGFLDVKSAIKKEIDRRIDLVEGEKFRITPRIIRFTAAAIVLLALGTAFYFTRRPINTDTTKQLAQIIRPGGNKATLTLSNGTRIVLDDAHKGHVAQQSNVNITKTANNQIVYNVTANGQAANDARSAADLRNTISTPNGGQYQLLLPDGTMVVLNAASSLTYPAQFRGSERVVQLTGEAYFEVAKNKKMPFKVVAGNQTVQVLGTHFNINAYGDEASVKTTLLEGSVKVSSGGNSSLIVPGQQAITITNQAGVILKREVDADQEIAWKNGLFSFENEDIRTIMRQVARWYDVKVVYAGNTSDEKFVGEISRNSNLSDVFKILELNGVHLEVQGKTVTVSAKK